ncbi:heat shock 70 kDa protein 12A-like [Mytilus galloprovincialis]|uniref:heat shock 70 kDa protein 12A-like n=1 Tax=Mytilus galloprovincialis TaxID=29158 RepID=UPI003F7B6692
MKEKPRDDDLPLFVGTIDFGTTFSGYAYMSKDEFQGKTKHIETRAWRVDRWTRHKAPTSVLFDEWKHFHTFGYEAEEHFHEYVKSGSLDKWYFFQNFKLEISKQAVLDDTFMLYDIRRKNRMRAVDVVMEIIKYLKGDLLSSLNQRLTNFDDSLIQWVLTVPVTWSLTARNFMRKTAYLAGIPKHQLKLLPEAEAAAFYCGQKELDIQQSSDGAAFLSELPSNYTFLVADLGGGTIDITVHQKGHGKVQKVMGLEWGSKKVNECFEDYCLGLFGDGFTDLRVNNPDDYLFLMENFEQEKLQFTTEKLNKVEKILIRLPASLLYNKTQKLAIPTNVFRSFYDNSIDGLIRALNELFHYEEMKNVKTIIAVGGFAESSIIINELRSSVKGLDIVVPGNPGLAVMRGAILNGFIENPNTNEPKSKYGTFGRRSLRRSFRNLSFRRAGKYTCGNDSTDKQERFLSEIFGSEIVMIMKTELEQDFFKFCFEFQKKIRKFKNGNNLPIEELVFSVPYEWRDRFSKLNNKSLEEKIRESEYKDFVSCEYDKLKIKWPFFHKYFSV